MVCNKFSFEVLRGSPIFETIESDPTLVLRDGSKPPQSFSSPRAKWPLVDTIDAYLEALASARPTPGGGSAATIVAAAGAALVAMVARLTAANEKYRAKRSEAERLVAKADTRRRELLEARTADENAYANVVAAQALGRATPEEKSRRTALVQTALAEAAAAPLVSAKLALAVLQLASEATLLENEHLASDVGCAAEFAAAAIAAAAYNVRVNHRYMRDAEVVARQTAELESIEVTGKQLLAAVRAALS
jgi:formiminotetrahydrofolate cyclodeaminase